MNEPRYQFWRLIQPVEGEPIPEGAEFRHPDEKRYHPTYRGERWNGWPVCLKWRVPVPVIPEDVAVDAIMAGVKYYRDRDDCYVCGLFSEELSSDCTHKLRELVIAKLREMPGDSK